MGDLVLICARGGSKGLPGKNIRPLGGRPLIGWPIATALQLPGIDRIVVSTDSDEIARIGREQGAETPFLRPPELARDDSPEWLVWRHALDFLASQGQRFDRLIVLPATAPLRSVQDVQRCRETLDDSTDMVITVCAAHRSPWFNMVKLDEHDYAHLVNQPEGGISRRQDAPVVFDMTTVAYVTRPDFVKQYDGVFAGRVRSVEVPVSRAVDIDTALDFKFAEFLLQHPDEES